MFLPKLFFLKLKQLLHSVSELLFFFVFGLESDCNSVETQVLLKTTRSNLNALTENKKWCQDL